MKNFKKAEKPKEIAKKKKVSLDQILKQLSMGKKVEKEHTNNANIAKMIALQHLGELPDYYSRLKKIEMKEDLRNWFNPKHPDGGWKRINSKGEAIGPCARKPGEPKPKCMSNKKRSQLSKKERAAAVAAKRKHDSVADRKGKGGKPINVSNFGKGRISEAVENLFEKNKPTNPALWARAKAAARSKFDVYPSAYANGWAAKWYKGKGGGWKSVKEAVQDIRTKRFIREMAQRREESPENYRKRLLDQIHRGDIADMDVHDRVHGALAFADHLSGQYGRNIPVIARVMLKGGEQHAQGMRITGIDKKGKMLTGHPVGAGGSPARHGTPVQNPLSAVTGLHVGRYSDIKPEHLDILRRLMNFRGKQMRESTLRDIIKVIMEEKKSKKPYKGFKSGFSKLSKKTYGRSGKVVKEEAELDEMAITAARAREHNLAIDRADHRAWAYTHPENPQGMWKDGKAKSPAHIKKGKALEKAYDSAVKKLDTERASKKTYGRGGKVVKEEAELDEMAILRDIIKVIMEEKKSKKPYKGFKKGKNHPEGGLSRSEAKRQGIHAGIETKDEAKRKGGFSKLSKKTQGRRKSFCGRMCGMKRKNTSSKTARDPKSKINASLRVWGCRCEETCHECDKQLFGEEAVANAMGGGFSVQQAATQANPSLAGYDPPMGKPLSVSSFDKLTPTPNTKNSVKKALDMWRRRKIAESTLSSDQVNKKEERVKELKKHIGKFKLRYGDNAKSIIYAIATRDAKKIHEEIVNSSNAGTMTKGEIRKRDKTASKVKARPIKGDTEEESKHRIATFITLRSRGKKKKK